jgi:hypothetical protein
LRALNHCRLHKVNVPRRASKRTMPPSAIDCSAAFSLDSSGFFSYLSGWWTVRRQPQASSTMNRSIRSWRSRPTSMGVAGRIL